MNSEARKRNQPRTLEVTVRIVDDPRMGRCVLLQLPDGYVVTTAADARNVAAALVEAADEITPKEIVVQPCPECRANKHLNCNGQAWDYVADELAPCPCAGTGHQGGAS